MVKSSFELNGKVALITGGAGLLGVKHAEAIAEYGGIPVLLDIAGARAESQAARIGAEYHVPALGMQADITSAESLRGILAGVLAKLGRIDILVNNAANDPKVKSEPDAKPWTRFENFPVDIWQNDIAVGLTGAFLCSQVFGSHMARAGSGVILNIASDLGVIAPDQRIYRRDGLSDEMQNVKPVTYSVVKTGLIGLTRYLATYWAAAGVRVNALSPGGVRNNQPEEFVAKLTNLIPMGRMAEADEYKAAVIFLVSDASSYMTGSNLIIEGGRTCW